MATVMADLRGANVRDRGFFFVMALVIAATVVAGFLLPIVVGRTNFRDPPWWVHVHGLTFMGWLGLYVVLNALAWRGSVAQHRRLGWFAAFYLGWMVLVGVSVNTLSAITHRIPPFFEPNVFLVMDWETVLVFAGLTWVGVRMRARTDWHRRLMLCGALQVMTPGVGRLMPLPLLGPWALGAIWCVILVFGGVAATYDVMTRGKVHPAYFWGFGTITLGTVLIRPLAFTPPMLALTHYLVG